MPPLSWRLLESVDASAGFIYVIRVIDDTGQEFRYAGKARSESRLKEYRSNMTKIFAGRPRGKKQGYRAVHLALAKALENGWQYDFVVVENATKTELLARETHFKNMLGCNLNGARTWHVSQYESLSVTDLLRNSGDA
jgi:hypothetical protein